jgi:hypothetical protein
LSRAIAFSPLSRHFSVAFFDAIAFAADIDMSYFDISSTYFMPPFSSLFSTLARYAFADFLRHAAPHAID